MFHKGQVLHHSKSPVNKGLAMLQMLVAKSGDEKDHHAASALIDRQMIERLSRIERRLELADAE